MLHLARRVMPCRGKKPTTVSQLRGSLKVGGGNLGDAGDDGPGKV